MHNHRKFISLFILILFIFYQIPSYAKAETDLSKNKSLPVLNIATPCAILIDAKTGNILYEKNSNVKMYPASITKIMTAILALENEDLQTKITMSKKAVTSIERGSSNAGLLIGEKLTLEQLLHALLLWSANESANAIAEEVGGSVKGFAKMMNERAKDLGAKNTNFVNPNGLHDTNHYTTAYDMAVITKHAMSIPKFREIVSTKHYVIPPTNKNPDQKDLYNKNKLILPTSRYYYPHALGIKTGYTVAAGSTLVSAAKKDGIELITVVLNSPINGKAYMYTDSAKMFEYGFDNFTVNKLIKENETIDSVNVKKSNQKVKAVTQNELCLLLPKDINKNNIQKIKHIDSLSVPINQGDVIGNINFKINEQKIGKVNLISNKNIKEYSFESKTKTFFKYLVIIIKWIFISIVILFVLFIIYTIIYNKIRLKRRKRKKRGL